MKKTMKLAVIAFAVLGICSFSIAQQAGPKGGQRQGGGPGMMMRGGPEMMAKMKEIQASVLKKIGATPAQAKAVEAANEKAMKAMQALRPKDAGKGAKTGEKGQRPQMSPELREKMKSIRDKQQAELKTALGGKFEAFQKGMMEEMQKLMGQRGKGAGAGKGRPGGQ